MSAPVEQMAAALRSFEVRVTFGVSMSLSQGSVQTARVETKQGGKWKQVGPLLLPPEGGQRADLLRLLAALLEQEPQEAAS